jgi:ABC-type Fe3+ transport system substrate-binding protein
VLVAFDAVSLLKDAPHPNAARLLLDFLTWRKGRGLAGSKLFACDEGLQAKATGLKPEDGGFKPVYLYPAEIDRNMSRWQGIVQQMFR